MPAKGEDGTVTLHPCPLPPPPGTPGKAERQSQTSWDRVRLPVQTIMSLCDSGLPNPGHTAPAGSGCRWMKRHGKAKPRFPGVPDSAPTRGGCNLLGMRLQPAHPGHGGGEHASSALEGSGEGGRKPLCRAGTERPVQAVRGALMAVVSAALGRPSAGRGCCQADFTRGGCSCPSPFIPQSGTEGAGNKHLRAARTWQHVIKAGAGFGVAQQRLWSEDYQLEGGRGG